MGLNTCSLIPKKERLGSHPYLGLANIDFFGGSGKVCVGLSAALGAARRDELGALSGTRERGGEEVSSKALRFESSAPLFGSKVFNLPVLMEGNSFKLGRRSSGKGKRANRFCAVTTKTAGRVIRSRVRLCFISGQPLYNRTCAAGYLPLTVSFSSRSPFLWGRRTGCPLGIVFIYFPPPPQGE